MAGVTQHFITVYLAKFTDYLLPVDMKNVRVHHAM
jgi:hypothetical protein